MNARTSWSILIASTSLLGLALTGCLTALHGPAASQTYPASPRSRISIDDNWRFIKGDPTNNTVALRYDDIKRWILPTGNPFIKDPSRQFVEPTGNLGDGVEYVQPGFDAGLWEKISLPHDWAIAGPFTHSGGGGMGRLPTAGVGWYRKKLDVPAGDAGKSIFLDVDGAMSYSTVWLNGQIVGGWPYGYSSWRVDLTPFVKPGGQNELAIRLDSPPNSSRWYPGTGIYRNVWLVKASPVHVGQWGTCIRTPSVSSNSATVNLKTTVDNDSKQPAAVSVTTELIALDADGKKSGKAAAKIGPENLEIPPGQSADANGSATIANPKLWGPPPTQKPNRYVAVTTVSQDGKVVDNYETPFGIRSVKFDSNAGVFVNGEHVKLNGVCDHHDLGALGAAFNTRAAQRQLELLQEMGCNALRTSHNPPAPELLELCDKMGFLVMDEAFDCWMSQKTPNDYHLLFADWNEQDLRAQLRRDRNHPSVIMWSIGNEVGEQGNPRGGIIASNLTAICHQEDPTRPTTSAMNSAGPSSAIVSGLDLIGLNYQGAGLYGGNPRYPDFHSAWPDKLVYGSETVDAYSTRGYYTPDLPPAGGRGGRGGGFGGFGGGGRGGGGGAQGPRQVNSYDLEHAGWSYIPDVEFAAQARYPFIGGEFVWTGFDYLGEPSPYDSSRSSYSGILDLAGFKKDRFYLYQSVWRPDFPMAHIVPQNWNWQDRTNPVTPVHIYTSGDSAELFLNEKSLGMKKKAGFEYRLRWDDVVYEPGELRVVAYKNGKHWATDEIKTTGAPAKLKLTPDRARIVADGKDLSFVTVAVTDAQGLMAASATNRVSFDIKGPGEIVATDNGDPTDFDAFPSHDRKAFNGLALAIVRAKKGERGTITVAARSEGLTDATTKILVQ